MTRAMPYIPSVDGLRAIAVVGVILNHYGQGTPGGFLGVDVFFVISGFVITRLIFNEIEQGHFTFAGFYIRRARRILPALLIVIAATLILGWFTLTPSNYSSLSISGLAAAFGVSNFYFWTKTNYFELPARYLPLLHTWSLGIEEQFYLVWPAALLFLTRNFERIRLLAIGSLIAIGLAVSILIGTFDPSASFYLPVSRAWELAIGCLLVFIEPAKGANTKLAAIVGLIAVFGSYLFFTEDTLPAGMLALPACAGAAAIIWAREDQTFLPMRLLTTRLMTSIGRISYSLYLWHWPILVFFLLITMRKAPNNLQAIGLETVSLALAWASWRFVETPIRNSSNRIGLSLVAASFFLVFSFASYVLVSHGASTRITPSAKLLADGSVDFSKTRKRCHRPLANIELPLDQSCRYGATTEPDIVVWSDSHGVEISDALGERLKTAGHSLLSITYSSCPPAIGFDTKIKKDCLDHNAAVLAFIIGNPNLRTVLLTSYHDYYMTDDRDGYLAGLKRTVAALTAAGKRVILLAPHPIANYPVPETAARLEQAGENLDSLGVNRIDYLHRREPLMGLFRSLEGANVKIIDPINAYCGDSICPVVAEGRALLFDSHHLSMFGASRVANSIDLDVLIGAVK